MRGCLKPKSGHIGQKGRVQQVAIDEVSGGVSDGGEDSSEETDGD